MWCCESKHNNRGSQVFFWDTLFYCWCW
jgi:hypothetical protein